MKTINIAVITGAAIVCFLTGCASRPVNLPPVGPVPSHALNQNAPHGYLRVYSDTETHEIGKNTYYYPHTSYSVYDSAGWRVKWVANHIGDMDETPTLVKIPIGHYYVVAQSTSYGRVTIPVVIQDGKWTVLHLDHNWRPAPNVSAKAIIRLPDGEPVGYSVASRSE